VRSAGFGGVRSAGFGGVRSAGFGGVRSAGFGGGQLQRGSPTLWYVIEQLG
jgi:hypothetical protein